MDNHHWPYFSLNGVFGRPFQRRYYDSAHHRPLPAFQKQPVQYHPFQSLLQFQFFNPLCTSFDDSPSSFKCVTKRLNVHRRPFIRHPCPGRRLQNRQLDVPAQARDGSPVTFTSTNYVSCGNYNIETCHLDHTARSKVLSSPNEFSPSQVEILDDKSFSVSIECTFALKSDVPVCGIDDGKANTSKTSESDNSSKDICSEENSDFVEMVGTDNSSLNSGKESAAMEIDSSAKADYLTVGAANQQSPIQQDCDTSVEKNGLPMEEEKEEEVVVVAAAMKRLTVPINGLLSLVMKRDLGEILKRSCLERRANHCFNSNKNDLQLSVSSKELDGSGKKRSFSNHYALKGNTRASVQMMMNHKTTLGNGTERRSPRGSPKQLSTKEVNLANTSGSGMTTGSPNHLPQNRQSDAEKSYACNDKDGDVIVLNQFVNGDETSENDQAKPGTSTITSVLNNIKTEPPESLFTPKVKKKSAKPSEVVKQNKKRWNHFKGSTYCMAIRPGNKNVKKFGNGSSLKKSNLEQISDIPSSSTIDSDAVEQSEKSNRTATPFKKSSSCMNSELLLALKPTDKDQLTVTNSELGTTRSLSSAISGMSSKLQMALLNGSNKRSVRDTRNSDKEELKIVSSSDLTTNSDVTDIDSVAGDSSDLLNGDLESVEDTAVTRIVRRPPTTPVEVRSKFPEKSSQASSKRKRVLRNQDETDSASTSSDHGILGAKKTKVVSNLDGMKKWNSLLSVPFLQDVEKNQVTTVTVQQLECITQGNPLCTCKTHEGSYSAENCPEGYCQGIDYIDGRLIGCVNAVSSKEMLRPSVKVPFQALCEVHRQRMRFHQCCPGCGLFCTQGAFIQCRADTKKAIHHCHKDCIVYQEGRELCPHCGEGSSLFEVALELNAPRSPAFFQRTQHGVRKETGARMAFTRGNKYIVSRDPCANQPSSSCTLKESGKEISSAGLPIGPDRSQLESLLVNISNGQPVNLRYTLKNLHTSAKIGDVEKVLQVLMMGFDPNTKFEEFQSQTLLHVAACHGHLALVHVVVQAGASLDVMDHKLQTPVMCSIENSHTSITQYLIKAGAQLDARGEDGMTSIHLAAREGQLEVCHMILDSGKVNVNIYDDGGWTPLVWAAEHRHVDVVQFLLERGSDPNLRDNEQNIALHWSAFSGSLEISEVFLNHGCDLNSVNELGDTPLHIAARQDRYEVVMLFLARNAEVHVINKENETPLMCCPDSSSQTWLALSMTKHLKKFSGNRTTRAEVIVHKDIARGKEQNAIQCVNGVDDEGAPSDFIYVRDNCETSPINMDRSIATLQHCDCEDDCSSPKCICGSMSLKCWYDREGHLIDEFNLFDPPMIFECNRSCRCWTTCNNRVVQHGISCRLQLFRTKGKGWGVRALRDIPRGTFICEYVGELISDLDADQRADDSYLFDLDNKDGETYCIDARHYGNIARFINHLCEPNLVPVKIFVDYQDLRFPRIAFFSSRTIRASEELGFDYGDKFWIIKYKMFTCLCGTEKCKYSETTIHETLANYNQRMTEEQ